MKKKRTVLVIDDEETVLAAMKDMLELKGYNVLEANNGVSGLKILTERAIDLVVLDLNMPRMDGYMFMEHLKERWELDNKGFVFPKIMILTAVDKGTDLGLAHNLGASKFMNKPFKSSDFIAAVKELTS